MKIAYAKDNVPFFVDDEDYDWVITNKWSIASSKGPKSTNQLASFYLQTGIWDTNKKKIRCFRLHYILWFLYYGKVPKGYVIKIKDGNYLNMTKDNLMLVPRAEINFGKKKTISDTTSRFKGVSLTPSKRWAANINKEGKQHYLGIFDTEEEAAKAYNMKALELFGPHIYLNNV